MTTLQDQKALQIYLSLALKRVSKPLRKQFSDPSWMDAEEAEKLIAEHLVKELHPFEFTQKPVRIPNTHRGHEPSISSE